MAKRLVYTTSSMLLVANSNFMVLIMQMEREIRELTKQRDLAQSRVEDLLRMVGFDQDSRQEVYIFGNLLQSLSF